MRALPAILLLCALSGCASCQPLLDVRHCIDGCTTGPGAVEVVWTQEDAQAWPDVERLMAGLAVGEHEHEAWTQERARAFWDHYGVDDDEPELVVHREEEQFRVRVLACD